MRTPGEAERIIAKLTPFLVAKLREALGARPGALAVQSIGLPESRAAALEVWSRLTDDERERARLFDSQGRLVLCRRGGRRLSAIGARRPVGW